MTAEQKIEILRSALVGLVGAESPEELSAMEAAISVFPGADSDKAAALNAIHALQALNSET